MSDTASTIKQLTSTTGFCMQIGITPSFYDHYDWLLSVEQEQSTIDTMWPGDSTQKRAELHDWRTMSWPRDSFASIVGMNVFDKIGPAASVKHLQQRCFHWLEPGGVFAVSVTTRPDQHIALHDIRMELHSSQLSWEEFVTRIMLHLADLRESMVPMSDVRDLFDTLAPNRDKLPWPRQIVDTIEQHKDSKVVRYFPSKEELLQLIPVGAEEPMLITLGDTTDPVLTWKKPAIG